MVELLGRILALSVILGPGALAPADAGCLERVAERRVTYGWGLASDLAVDSFDALLGVEDCELVGAEGLLVAEGGVYSVLVVDCQSDGHEPLSERGLVADVNRQDLGHEEGMVILWP